MTTVIAEISVSLDGYVTGPDPGPDNGLGTGGEALHTWALAGDAAEQAILRDRTRRSGAVVMGRRLFDLVDAPGGWDDGMGYGAREVGEPSFVVVTHEAPSSVRLQLDVAFVTDGIAAAVERARSLAGDEDVVVMGGADVVRQCVLLGLADELLLHVAPVVLGGGIPLFTPDEHRELGVVSSVATTNAVHLTFRV